MRRFLALLLAGVATVAIAAAASPAATTPTNFTVRTTLDARDAALDCCTDTVDASTSGAFARIGRASVSEVFDRCGPSYCYPDGQNHVSMAFVTRSGDTLLLVGGGLGTTFTPSGFTGTGSWFVWSPASTGRFAGATGSGTYTATFTFNGVFVYPYSYGTLDITLSGNLSFRPAS